MNLLQMSFYGGIMIIVVILVRKLFINILPKRTFLALWGVVLLRLLIPFSIPSAFSAYSVVEQPYSYEQKDDRQETEAVSSADMEHTAKAPLYTELSVGNRQVSVFTMLWILGVILLLVFYMVSYWRSIREFRLSLPIEQKEAEEWLASRQIHRRIELRYSDRITTPLTYGILHPVILVPKNLDWEKSQELQYVLSHELIHIRHLDTVKKLFLILTVCVHWFNPLVWVMYRLANRDMELACDEEVLSILGRNNKAEYARTLIGMEEKKLELMPFCSGFSKNGIEERITAIMKTKKKTIVTAGAAILVVALISIIFATSAKTRPLKDFLTRIPGNEFTQEESDRLFSLWIDGYEDMTLAEFQEKMWTAYDNPEDVELISRFSLSESTYQLADSKEAQAFGAFYDYFFTVYEPLTAENWKEREFGGFAATSLEEAEDNAVLEYTVSLKILDADKLLVKEYEAARTELLKGMHDVLKDKTREELENQETIENSVRMETEALKKKLNSDSLAVDVVSFSYIPLAVEPENQQDPAPAKEEMAQASEQGTGDTEAREYPYGTKEDYASLLSLKTKDYQKQTLTEFNQKLLDWGNEDSDRWNRVIEDIGRADYQVSLSDQEKQFLSTTVTLSRRENARKIAALYKGKPQEDPWAGGFQYTKADEGNHAIAWCDFYYQFPYHINDMNQVTVKERDDCVGGMIEDVAAFWEKSSIEELLSLTKEDMTEKMKAFAEKNSDSNITITIDPEQIGYECMNERGIDQ